MELLIVSSNELFVKNTRETVNALRIIPDLTVSMEDARQLMKIKQFDVVVIDDENNFNGAYLEVLSINKAMAEAKNSGVSFYEPHNIVVVTKALRSKSNELGARLIDARNGIGELIPFLTSIK